MFSPSRARPHQLTCWRLRRLMAGAVCTPGMGVGATIHGLNSYTGTHHMGEDMFFIFIIFILNYKLILPKHDWRTLPISLILSSPSMNHDVLLLNTLCHCHICSQNAFQKSNEVLSFEVIMRSYFQTVLSFKWIEQSLSYQSPSREAGGGGGSVQLLLIWSWGWAICRV